MNTKLKDKIKLVCHGQAPLGRASIPISPPTRRRVHPTISNKSVTICVNLRPNDSLFQAKPLFSENFFSKSKPNFPKALLNANTCYEKVYINSHPQNHKKSKPKANPIQTQYYKNRESINTTVSVHWTPNPISTSQNRSCL